MMKRQTKTICDLRKGSVPGTFDINRHLHQLELARPPSYLTQIIGYVHVRTMSVCVFVTVLVLVLISQTQSRKIEY